MSFFSGGLAGVIGGVTDLASIPLQNYFNKKAASKENQYSWDMMKYQNDWNLEQWNRENEYNSPKNIMARYQEAGLNPNLIYGNSYQSPAHLESASGTTPRVQAPKVDLGTGLQSVLQAYNLEAQHDLIKAQQNEVNARTKLLKTQNANWTKDHANYQREIIDLVKGYLGKKGILDYLRERFGSGNAKKHAAKVKDDSKPALGDNVLDVDPDWSFSWWPF